MGTVTPNDDDDVQQFFQQLCQYKPHTLMMIHEYFQEELHYIVENLNTGSLLCELDSRHILDVKRYASLENDRKTLARTLLQDIFLGGSEAVMGLWVSLYNLRSRLRDLLALHAVLEELCHIGDTLEAQIQLDKYGHQLGELEDVQKIHREHLHEKTRKLTENQPPGCDLGEESFSLCTRYNNLIIVSTDHFRKRFTNELVDTGTKHENYLKETQNELQRVFLNKIFSWCHKSRLVPHLIMVSGVPGVGKTTLMQKFVYDWVRWDLYQRFSFVFFFKFRDLNRLKEKVSLEGMILHQYPYLELELGDILQKPETVLFIFDGLDESKHQMDFSHHLCSHPQEKEDCGQVVASLLKKSLLDGCYVLMTSRPTRLASIDCTVFQKTLEITGFFPEERQIYFENFFSDPELGKQAFNYVKQNDTLYTFCYLPSYCWIICTVLSKSFQPTSDGQLATLIPKTVTQLFAIFVANILSNHSLDKSDAQKLLRSIGWMAEHGVMNHLVVFDDLDLGSFHVDKQINLLSSFLMESEEPGTYSFLHLTVQEFLSALVHYVDYSAEKIQKSLKRAKSHSDGRGEIFLRFLCGLSDGSTRSKLKEYLDKQAAQASKDVISWLMNNISEEKERLKDDDKKRHLLSTFFYLFETRNKDLVSKSLKSRTSIDLSTVYLSALDCTVLAFVMENCRDIQELNLQKCSLSAEGLERLAPALHNLHDLRLNGNNLPETSCTQLVSIIKNNPSLKKLSLSDNCLFGSFLKDLMEALSSPGCDIQELYLANNDLLDSNCIQLAAVIRHNKSLRILDLSLNRLYGLPFSDLIEALSSPDCRIEELRLVYTGLPDTACPQLASVIKKKQSLKILDLSGNQLSGPDFNDLIEALSSPDCRMQILRLTNNRLSKDEEEEITKLKNHNPNLKILY